MKSESRAKRARTAVSIAAYERAQPAVEASICRRLRAEIERALPGAASKVWHGAPVWFVGETPVVGYSVPARGGVMLLFWNGQSLGDPVLQPVGKFRAAQIHFATASEIKAASLRRWLKKAGTELVDMDAMRGTSVKAGGTPQKAKPGKKMKHPAEKSASRLIDERIRSLRDWRGETLAEVRRIIHEADPDIVEECKWIKPGNPMGVPVWSHAGIVCTGEVYKEVVKLTFARGAVLDDPKGLFNASLGGSTRRAIDIREGDVPDSKALTALIRAAVKENLRSKKHIA